VIATACVYAVIIVLEALGFIVWNVGTRSPLHLARDVVHGLRDQRIFKRSIAPFVLGGVCLVLAFAILSARNPSRGLDGYVVTAMIVLAGLAVEFLIGRDVRAKLGPRTAPPA
jgi:hypothetical protein